MIFAPVGKVRHSDPATSGMAADAVDVNPQEMAILSLLAKHPHGMTVWEMMQKEEMWPYKQSAISTRMARLVTLGKVEVPQVPVDKPEEGKPLFVDLKRKTDTGRLAMVYRIRK